MADQLTPSQLLVKYGFVKKHLKGTKYIYDEKKGYYVPKDSNGSYEEKDADEDMQEEVNITYDGQYIKTGYPKCAVYHRLVYENYGLSLENFYFWPVEHMRQDMAFPKFIKITDLYGASESSASWGQNAQRLAIQEDRASNFLRTIAEMIKTMFQIVRELRIIDERLEIYDNWKESKSADVTLKGLYADFAENKGGQMQPGSLYHLSDKVGYAALPDLFFNTVVYDRSKIDEIVDSLGYNTNLKAVLKRKLFQFLVWKKETHKELKARKRYQVKYLRQHYTTIKTYMSWVKPYLKHIRRLSMDQDKLDGEGIVSSFETSHSEVEVLSIKPIPKTNMNAVICMSFEFKTRPTMQYRQEQFQGPVHVGRGIMRLRSYGWTDHEIDMYRKMRDYEDRELLGLVDDQLKSAMELLGADLEEYLRMAEQEIEPETPKKEEKLEKSFMQKITSEESVLDPFISIFRGFGEFMPTRTKSTKTKSTIKPANEDHRKKALRSANTALWLVYKNYKKAHKLLSW